MSDYINDSNDIWCPIPWSHLSVKTNGTLRLCSHSQSGGNQNTLLKHNNNVIDIKNLTPDFLNCDTLKDVRKTFLNNQWPSQCRRCKIEHESGKRSRNQWERLTIDFKFDEARKNTLDDGTLINPKVLSMDIRPGNKCNLQCVMCYPGESNQWYKIQEKVTNSNTFMMDNVVYLTTENKSFDWGENEESYNALINYLPTVKRINFGGGEPFLLKKHIILLNKMIEMNVSKDIELEYSINVTTLPDYIFSLFEHFRVVKLCSSIDGIEEVNDAIRFPSKWESIKNNLIKLDNTKDNIEVFISSTISILNIEHTSTLMNWIKNQKFKKINKHTFEGYVSHPVISPKYLSLRLMDDNQHLEMFSYLKDQTTDPMIIKKLAEWEILSKKLPITTEEIQENRKKLKNFFNTMSTIQNKDWSKIFPKCHEMINQWTTT